MLKYDGSQERLKSLVSLTYYISLDKHVKEIAKAPNLKGLSYDVDGDKITCVDGETVDIVAKDKEHHARLKVAFQLACRHEDKWQHYFRLSTKDELQKQTEEKSLDLVNNEELESWYKKFARLNYTVLLYIHRASDFVNLYSEVAVVTALFGLELQVNKIYDPLDENGRVAKKRKLKCVEGLYDKICNLRENGFIKTENDLKLLLALTGLRNKLAHVKLDDLKAADVYWCDGKLIDKLIHILDLRDGDFIYSTEEESRLKHPASIRLINKIIEAIMILRNIAP